MSPRGGRRSGAGRKPGSGRYGEPTRPWRIPQSLEPLLAAWLAAHTDRTGRRPQAVASLKPAGVRRTLLRPTVRVPAGFPSPADDFFEAGIDLNEHLIVAGHEAQTFLVRVTGWSMIGAGIHDGDEVLVDRAIEPRDGAVVVVARNGELSIKRLRLSDDQITLVSENPDYPPVVWREGEDWHFWGVAIRVLHRL